MKPKQRIVLAVGLPASGKSTWFAEQGVTPLSSDQMRLALGDDENDQSIHVEVFESLRYMLLKRIQIGRPVSYIDATNLRRLHRGPFLRLAEREECVAEALFFDTPLEVCLDRNRSRNRRVPEDVLREMAQTIEPPLESEGFRRIVRIAAPVRRA